MKRKPWTKMTFSEWVGVAVASVIVIALKEYIYHFALFWGIPYERLYLGLSLAFLAFIIYRVKLTKEAALIEEQRAADDEGMGHA